MKNYMIISSTERACKLYVFHKGKYKIIVQSPKSYHCWINLLFLI